MYSQFPGRREAENQEPAVPVPREPGHRPEPAPEGAARPAEEAAGPAEAAARLAAAAERRHHPAVAGTYGA